MVFDRNRKFILGGTATALVVAGGVYASTAFAQSPSSSPSATPSTSASATASASASSSSTAKPNASSFLSHLASRLNISQDQLSAAMKGAAHDAVNDAVAAGKLTQQQATQINQRIDSGKGPGFGFGPGGPRPNGAGPRGAFFHGGQGIQAAAKALNMQPSDLIQQLRSGKTLAQIAQAQNVQLSTVTTAITNAVKPGLDQAVSSGKMTQQQETDILNTISSGQFPAGRPFGPGPRGSARPAASPSSSASV